MQGILARYQRHVRLTTALAESHHVATIFVGQPVPFLSYPMRLDTYPFPATATGHQLCQWGYNRFELAARQGGFGTNFIWCGDAFTNATESMYADSIHYSPAGCAELAKVIATRAEQHRLLPAR